ncbi:MAG: DUF177 domain-containing protein [Clostridia bacterium]|nr:DUF177 domain-containing protein [Clostridia bacterium]
MIIDLKKVFVNEGFSLPIEYELDMSKEEFSGVFPLITPVKFNGTVSNKASLVGLNAQITYDYSADCDRCGKHVVHSHSIVVEKDLAPSIEGEENERIVLVPDMKLDLEQLVFTEVVTSLPMKHLCDENCKGLCPKCGKNLNEGDCGCPKKEIDPRLQALADLLK